MGQCNKMLEEMSFNALFQKLPVGIEVYDERGQLVDLNRTDENLFAISRKDIMGINLGNYILLYTITKIIKGHITMYPFIIQSFFSFFFPFPSFLTLQERVFRKRGSRGSIFGL